MRGEWWDGASVSSTLTTRSRDQYMWDRGQFEAVIQYYECDSCRPMEVSRTLSGDHESRVSDTGGVIVCNGGKDEDMVNRRRRGESDTHLVHGEGGDRNDPGHAVRGHGGSGPVQLRDHGIGGEDAALRSAEPHREPTTASSYPRRLEMVYHENGGNESFEVGGSGYGGHLMSTVKANSDPSMVHNFMLFVR